MHSQLFSARLLWPALLLTGLTDALAAEAPTVKDRELARQLATELKTALTDALQTSPDNAITVCSERAPQIAARLGALQGVQIGRTALRLRNQANRPTVWQEQVLQDFKRRAAAGEPLATMEYTATVQQNGATERRYMKAIATEALCITCHGEQLAPGLQQAIATRYPSDAATGFRVGELRGAVYVIRRARLPEGG